MNQNDAPVKPDNNLTLDALVVGLRPGSPGAYTAPLASSFRFRARTTP